MLLLELAMECMSDRRFSSSSSEKRLTSGRKRRSRKAIS
jgi:hypothetical protein